MDSPSDISPSTLPSHGLTGALSEAGRARLAAKGVFQSVKKGHTLVAQGEAQDRLFILLSGEVAVTCFAPGHIIEIARLGEGVSIGEMSVIDPRPASADVTFTTPGEMWSLHRDDFFAFLHEDHENGLALLLAVAQIMAGRLRVNADKMLKQSESQRAFYEWGDY